MKEKIIEYLDKYIENLNKLKEINEKSPCKILISDYIQIHGMDSFDEICKELGLEYEESYDDEGYIFKSTFYKGIKIVSVQLKNAPDEAATSN